MPGRAPHGASSRCVARRDHALRIDRVNDAGAAPSYPAIAPRTSATKASRAPVVMTGGGGVRGLSREALRLVDGLMVLVLHRCDLLLSSQ